MNKFVNNIQDLFYDVGMFGQGLGQSYTNQASSEATAAAAAVNEEEPALEVKRSKVAEALASLERKKQWLEHTWDINHEQEGILEHDAHAQTHDDSEQEDMHEETEQKATHESSEQKDIHVSQEQKEIYECREEKDSVQQSKDKRESPQEPAYEEPEAASDLEDIQEVMPKQRSSDIDSVVIQAYDEDEGTDVDKLGTAIDEPMLDAEDVGHARYDHDQSPIDAETTGGHKQTVETREQVKDIEEVKDSAKVKDIEDVNPGGEAKNIEVVKDGEQVGDSVPINIVEKIDLQQVKDIEQVAFEHVRDIEQAAIEQVKDIEKAAIEQVKDIEKAAIEQVKDIEKAAIENLKDIDKAVFDWTQTSSEQLVESEQVQDNEVPPASEQVTDGVEQPASDEQVTMGDQLDGTDPTRGGERSKDIESVTEPFEIAQEVYDSRSSMPDSEQATLADDCHSDSDLD